MEKIILIDAGHGGLHEGDPLTPGKRATFKKSTIYEGVLNRAVAHLLNYELSIRNIKSEVINDNSDQPLFGRCFNVNAKISANKNKSYFLISIHHNASTSPDANGFECFTSIGETKSDYYANELMKLFEKKHPRRKARINTVSDPAKEENFQILKNTNCPAVLVEYCFMTNKDEFEYMTFHNGVNDEVNLFVDWIVNCVIKY